MRRLLLLFLLLLAAASAFAQGNRLVILSWDGAPGWVVERLISEGKLPNLQRMQDQGVYSSQVQIAPPSLTAAGFAQIWTGAFPSTTGVTGNTVPKLPRSDHSIMEAASGFNSESLRAEPIWVTAAVAGKSAAVLSATQSYPPEKWIRMIAEESAERGSTPAQVWLFSGFEHRLFSPSVYTPENAELKDAERFGRTGKEFEFAVGDQGFIAFFARGLDGSYQDCTIFRVAGDRVAFTAYMRAGTSPFAQPIEVRRGDAKAYMTFALLDMQPDLSDFMLYQGAANEIVGHADFTTMQNYALALGGFHDLPIFDLYAEGKLGKTMWTEGDGKAEERLLKLIERDYVRLSDGFRWTIRNLDPSLVIHYSSAIDSMGHMLMGILDPESPKHDAALARRLWPVYERTFQLADEWLGRVVEEAGIRAVVAVVSDHGMKGVGKQVSINRILVDAGLASEVEGRIDPPRSRALCSPWQDFSVSIHTSDWKGGIVAPDDKQSVIEETIRALLAFRDPATGEQVITRAVPASEIPGAGGEAGGDIYLDFATGYTPTSRLLTAPVADYGGVSGAGMHGYLPGTKKMGAIFYAAGPGLARGRDLGEMRAIDITPSVAILVGIPTPSNAEGRNLRLAQRSIDSDGQ